LIIYVNDWYVFKCLVNLLIKEKGRAIKASALEIVSVL
jgi:hypothetical protein